MVSSRKHVESHWIMPQYSQCQSSTKDGHCQRVPSSGFMQRSRAMASMSSGTARRCMTGAVAGVVLVAAIAVVVSRVLIHGCIVVYISLCIYMHMFIISGNHLSPPTVVTN